MDGAGTPEAVPMRGGGVPVAAAAAVVVAGAAVSWGNWRLRRWRCQTRTRQRTPVATTQVPARSVATPMLGGGHRGGCRGGAAVVVAARAHDCTHRGNARLRLAPMVAANAPAGGVTIIDGEVRRGRRLASGVRGAIGCCKGAHDTTNMCRTRATMLRGAGRTAMRRRPLRHMHVVCSARRARVTVCESAPRGRWQSW